ncbi:hypothetical protein KDL01_14415 [Actinospica durhamensis]|uniref:PE-PGRS family protein n=1 Tax=Actinospica durhamensis TaxID=1508375 RepID=A0A941IMQ6_9ACTN|nr:hypothetical protein [Actinospica durhamensis]MBR7834465.1 hypothetical protein [Actinospica durhamensis]
MEVGRSLRGARAAVFAAACVGVSAAGHAWMSDAPIAAWALVVAVLAVGGAAYALGGRQRGFASIAGLMLVGELGLHLLFSAAQQASVHVASGAFGVSGASGSSATVWMPDMSRIKMAYALPAVDWLCGHGMADMHDMAAGGTSAGSGSMASMSWVTSMPWMTWLATHGAAGMIGVHVVAGLLCAWWLRRGEAAMFQLLRALAGFAVPLLVFFVSSARPVLDFTVVVPDDTRAHVPSARGFLVHALVRRGPPTPVFSM